MLADTSHESFAVTPMMIILLKRYPAIDLDNPIKTDIHGCRPPKIRFQSNPNRAAATASGQRGCSPHHRQRTQMCVVLLAPTVCEMSGGVHHRKFESPLQISVKFGNREIHAQFGAPRRSTRTSAEEVGLKRPAHSGPGPSPGEDIPKSHESHAQISFSKDGP